MIELSSIEKNNEYGGMGKCGMGQVQLFSYFLKSDSVFISDIASFFSLKWVAPLDDHPVSSDQSSPKR